MTPPEALRFIAQAFREGCASFICIELRCLDNSGLIDAPGAIEIERFLRRLGMPMSGAGFRFMDYHDEASANAADENRNNAYCNARKYDYSEQVALRADWCDFAAHIWETEPELRGTRVPLQP